MIFIKNDKQIAAIEKSNIIVADTLAFIEKFIRPGVDTATINREAENYITAQNARPAFKGLYGFPAAACISVNDEVVHGIPGKRILRQGDIVGVDIGVELNGYYGDGARTFCVGRVSEDVKKLCEITKESLERGVAQCVAGNRIGDISYAIQSFVEQHHYSVVRDLVGHGVGIKPHEDPQVPNYGKQGSGPRIKIGMVLAIEPMINLGGYQVYTDDDEWTVRTVDGKPSAHFEYSVAVTKNGTKILTHTS